MPNRADYWIEKLKLQAHPEGGHYRETYRAQGQISTQCLPERFQSSRNFSTGIYYLLESGQYSAFHRIASDEMWHFYAGDTLVIYILKEEGPLEEIHLGRDAEAGEVFQAVVPAGYWFAARPLRADTFALVGCTVAPGFDFKDFEMADADALVEQFPEHQDLIRELSRD